MATKDQIIDPDKVINETAKDDDQNSLCTEPTIDENSSFCSEPHSEFKVQKSRHGLEPDPPRDIFEGNSTAHNLEEEGDTLEENTDELASTNHQERVPKKEGTSALRHRLNPEPPRSGNEDNGSIEMSNDTNSSKSTKNRRKISEIRKALQENPVNVAELRRLAISPGGLLNKSLRQKVWPLLIGASTDNISPKPSPEEMMANKDYAQVIMDVNRSSSRFPPGIDDELRMSMKDKLVDLVMRVIIKHEQLQYYQGFHDVCVTFLLCMDEDLAFAMVEKLVLGNMREFLDPTMERVMLLLDMVYPLINRCNPKLCQHLQSYELNSHFAVPWAITWFSHVMGDIRRIVRMFDFFLASHRLMPIYTSAAMVLIRENDIYESGDDVGFIHQCLHHIPKDLPLESLLERAGDLYLQYPPLDIVTDPMLLQLNRETHDHFHRIHTRKQAREKASAQQDLRGRLFVRTTVWALTAVMGVAAVVIYHSYTNGSDWATTGWNYFT